MECRLISHDSADYWLAVELRRDVLRKPLGLDYSVDQLMAEYSASHFVCKKDGEIVGSALGIAEGAGTIRVKQVAVRSDLQGHGIGRFLMEFVEQWALTEGFSRALLHSRGYAIPFYEKIGYSCFGDVFEEVGIPHCKMQKVLEAP